MKNLLILPIFITALSITFTPSVSASGGTSIAKSLCEYVAADDKKRLRSFLKANKLKIRNVFKITQCNGMNLLAFAENNSSLKTGALIINKLPKKVVSANLAVIKTTLLDVANKRVSS
jgi:hypothetical protein